MQVPHFGALSFKTKLPVTPEHIGLLRDLTTEVPANTGLSKFRDDESVNLELTCNAPDAITISK